MSEIKEVKNEVSNEECGICSCEVSIDKFMFGGLCNHKICVDCSQKIKNDKCPYCRRKIHTGLMFKITKIIKYDDEETYNIYYVNEKKMNHIGGYYEEQGKYCVDEWIGNIGDMYIYLYVKQGDIPENDKILKGKTWVSRTIINSIGENINEITINKRNYKIEF